MSLHSQTAVEIPQVIPDPRAVEVIQPIIDFIKQQIVDKQVTYDEWHAAVKFALDMGEAGEYPLFMDAFFESTVDEVANARSSSSSSAILGPYYVPDAPEMQTPAVMPQRPDEPGEPLVFTGRVTGADGEAVPHAILDVWHADANVPGTYSNIHPGQPDFNLRAKLHTDAQGHFELSTKKPAPYPIPDQGPTGKLMNLLGRHSWRPAHIHVQATAGGYKRLTTQIYFAGGDFVDSDSCTGVKDDLIVPLHEEDGTLKLRYDLRLEAA